MTAGDEDRVLANSGAILEPEARAWAGLPAERRPRAAVTDMLATLVDYLRTRKNGSASKPPQTEEDAPLRVHVTWGGGIRVDVAEQFRQKKVKDTLEVLRRIPVEGARRPTGNRGGSG